MNLVVFFLASRGLAEKIVAGLGDAALLPSSCLMHATHSAHPPLADRALAPGSLGASLGSARGWRGGVHLLWFVEWPCTPPTHPPTPHARTQQHTRALAALATPMHPRPLPTRQPHHRPHLPSPPPPRTRTDTTITPSHGQRRRVLHHLHLLVLASPPHCPLHRPAPRGASLLRSC